MTSPLGTCLGCLFHIIYRMKLNCAIRTGEYYASTFSGVLLLYRISQHLDLLKNKEAESQGTVLQPLPPRFVFVFVYFLHLIYTFLIIVNRFLYSTFLARFSLPQFSPDPSNLLTHRNPYSFFHETKKIKK